LLDAALAYSFQYLLKRLIESLFLLGDLKDRVKDDIIVVANSIEVPL
jgi:hypothetical protein